MNNTDPIWLRIQIKKIIWITGCWMLISIGQFFYEYAVFAQHDFLPHEYNFRALFLVSLVRMFATSLLGGSVIVFFFEKWSRTMPYFKAFFLMLGVYSVIFF